MLEHMHVAVVIILSTKGNPQTTVSVVVVRRGCYCVLPTPPFDL